MKRGSRFLLWLAALAATTSWGLHSVPGRGEAAAGTLRVLLMVVDGSQPVPRKLRHYERGQVTNVAWSDVATIHAFAFERDSSYARLFEEMSYGQLLLSGDTVALAFPRAASDLTWTEWTRLADGEARARGFDPDRYDRLLYVLPHLPRDAPARGLSLGERGWCAYLEVIELGCLFHELGHTLGMRHAAELRADGTGNGLGDDSDGLMGSGFNAHVNVVNKAIAGWLGGSRLETFDRTGSAAFGIAAQSASRDAPQAVKIVNNGARPVTGVVDTWVSFRDARGFDAQLVAGLPDHNGDPVANAVLVHQWARVFPGDTYYLEALREGDVYEAHGVRIAVDAISGDEAKIAVSRAPYRPRAPAVSVAPRDSSARPRGLVHYAVSIGNRNDPETTPFDSHYRVSLPELGADWIVGWAAGSAKTVPPGGTRSFEFIIGSPRNAAPGTYPFSIVVTDEDGDDGPVSAQASASYTVESIAGRPPTREPARRPLR